MVSRLTSYLAISVAFFEVCCDAYDIVVNCDRTPESLLDWWCAIERREFGHTHVVEQLTRIRSVSDLVSVPKVSRIVCIAPRLKALWLVGKIVRV